MKRLTLLVLLAACGGGAKPKPHHVDEYMNPPPAGPTDPSCPLEVPGTSISVEDTTNGAALVFVTTGDAAQVRAHANAFVAMHSKRNGPMSALGMMFPGDWWASEKDIDGGARIEFAAAKPDGAADLQSKLRMHASHLSSGSCAM